MKKTIIAMLILFISLFSVAQQAGRVKISFAGFKCLRETDDDPLQLDGKGDEVFLRFYFSLADRNGNTKLKYSNQTDTYGDNHGPFGNRINAGSCVDLFGNLKGGIKGGDNLYCNNIVGEYDLAAGDVLTVVPTIWEWDPGTGYQNSFDASIEGAYTIINQKASALSNQRFATTSITANGGGDALGLILVDAGTFLSFKAIFAIAGELTPKPRPIGITTKGEYSPKAVLLNANVMQQLASTNFGYGIGVIPVQYNEEALGNTRDHGNYIILLKVEFIPKQVAASTLPPLPIPPPPAPQNSGNKTIIPAVTNKNTGNQVMIPIKGNTVTPYSMNNEMMYGQWKGTINTNDGSKPHAFVFKINNSAFWLLDNNNVGVATGGFKIENNNFTSTYTYANGDSYTVTSTTFNSATHELSGNWSGNGVNAAKRGTWIVVKQSN